MKYINNELVKCDLEFPYLKKQLQKLDKTEFERLLKVFERINRMTWAQVYAATSKRADKRGLNWEILKHQKTSDDKTIATVRLISYCIFW